MKDKIKDIGILLFVGIGTAFLILGCIRGGI